jgi:hypothetical protein
MLFAYSSDNIAAINCSSEHYLVASIRTSNIFSTSDKFT